MTQVKVIRRRPAGFLCVVGLMALSVSACGGGGSKSGSQSVAQTTSTTTTSTAVNEAGRTYKPIPVRGQVVKVEEGVPDDNSMTITPDHVKTGLVTFEVINETSIAHDFEIAGKRTPVLGESETAVLTVNFTKPGNYSYSSRMGEEPGTFRVTR
jgi:hypothetical protein